MLTKKAREGLKAILKKDYRHEYISDEDAEELGVSLLRITKVSLQVLAREHEKRAVL